jgi:hypothetical protein
LPVAPSETPLFDFATDRVEARVQAGIANASGRAERLEPGWKSTALEVLRVYALTHERFLSEHVGIHVPSDADRRALGAVFREANRLGWLVSDGVERDQYGSHKTVWRSLICGGGS